MARLSIKNIGPIKEIDIELNRINIFIGPQSSGKSTIAKIVSFCQWLEKDCSLKQTVSHVDVEYVVQHLFAYHIMSSFIHDDSEFQYYGEGIEICFSTGKVDVTKTPTLKNMLLSKNMYLPSERNILAIPNIFNTKMPQNCLLEFIYDWQIIRTKYSSGSGLHLLDLKERYFFDSKNDTDRLLLENGRPIPLSEGSSGLQSVTPLCVCIDYLTDWIYSHQEDRSANDKRRYRDAVIARFVTGQVEDGDNFLDEFKKTSPQKVSELFQRVSNLVDSIQSVPEKDFTASGDEVLKSFMEEMSLLERSLSRPACSNLVVEEPEQNLFPDTQTKLLYYILSKINHSRDSLIITTHSPYILYAINNCMLAAKVSEEDVDEVEEAIDIPKTAWVDSNKVSVWEVDNGVIRGNKTIQDEKGLIRRNYFDTVMHNVMADFHILIDYSK